MAFLCLKLNPGKSILMSTKIFRDTLSVDRLKHYAEDAKKTIEEIESITQPEPTKLI